MIGQKDLFIRTRPRIPIPSLIRRTGSISTVWCWSGVWSRPSCWTSGLRPRFPPGWVCGKFYVSSSLHETCRSSFWTVSGWSHWCSITASSDWYLVFWFPSEKRKLFEKYFYFNLLKNSCIKTQATSFSYIIRKFWNFLTNSVCSVANAALTLSVAEINSIVNVNVRGTEFLVVWLFWLYRGF